MTIAVSHAAGAEVFAKSLKEKVFTPVARGLCNDPAAGFKRSHRPARLFAGTARLTAWVGSVHAGAPFWPSALSGASTKLARVARQ